MKNKYLNEDISILELDNDILINLKNHSINSIRDLWEQSRKILKSINLSDHDINKIIIKLQLLGLDLNKK